jgi:ribonuclease VapC
MMFVDASAIVAILTGEAEADALIALLDAAIEPFTSPIAVFEAVLGICRKRQSSVGEATEDVQQFLEAAQIRTAAVTPQDGVAALRAFSRYGKGRGHPAQLNLGDCFAYALAKTSGSPILCKGDDFTRTDIAVAGSISPS